MDWILPNHPELQRYVLAAGVAIAVGSMLFFVRWILERRAKAAQMNPNSLLARVLPALLRRIPRLTLVVFAIYAGTQVLDLSVKAETRIHQFVVLIALFQIGTWASFAIRLWLDSLPGRAGEDHFDRNRATAVRSLSFVANFVLWSSLFLVVLGNFGVNVTALVAGLGVGGIAVALAVQSVLGDLLASISIILDKPFAVGDSLTVDGFSGTVESVGVKTTRLRSATGEQLIFGNADLLKSRIQNFRRMRERRVALATAVSYGTPIEKLKLVPEILKKAVLAQEQVRFERSHLKQFGPNAVDFETVYWVLSPDYGLHMDVLQAVNFGIAESLKKDGIELSTPPSLVPLLANIGQPAKV